MTAILHWGRVTHMCVNDLTIICSDNGLSPDRCQVIIRTNAGILLIRNLEQTSLKSWVKLIYFHSRKSISKCRLDTGGHLVWASMCNPLSEGDKQHTDCAIWSCLVNTGPWMCSKRKLGFTLALWELMLFKPDDLHYFLFFMKGDSHVSGKWYSHSNYSLTVFIEYLNSNTTKWMQPRNTYIDLIIMSLNFLIMGSPYNSIPYWYGRGSVPNHQPQHCLLNRSFRRRLKKTSKLRVTGLCAGNSPGTGEFPAQMASNAENVSIWWRHLVDVTDYMTSLVLVLRTNGWSEIYFELSINHNLG